LFKRASNWKHIFDDNPAQLKIRAKNADGTWAEDTEFHEGTEQQYIWYFPHDWTALIDRLGGKAKAMDRLNALFAFDTSKPFAGREPSEYDLNADEGSEKFNIGNEISFPAPWAYNWAGSPKNAQYVIPLILNKTFTTAPSGLPGNDDLGATSGWYVWASLGLYPVVPSAPGLAVSTPQFDGITLWLADGKSLRIETGGTNPLLDDVRYISEMKLDDAPYQGTWLPLDKIKDGGKLTFTLSKTPTEWGADDALTPPSGPDADYTQATAKDLPAVQIVQ
jgi:putative alpha-1,2-mannosidase